MAEHEYSTSFPETTIGPCRVLHADCVEALVLEPANTFHACVTDPPYGLGFMGKAFDKLGSGVAQQAWHTRWATEVLRVLKPGAHLVAFGGTRTHHRLMCALEDAGFEIRDTLMWVHASGFPKSLDVSKMLDKEADAKRKVIGLADRKNGASGFVAGARIPTITVPATDLAREWDGYGTALKPAWEPIILARKPLQGTVVENVLKWGSGALNIDGCRIGTEPILGHGYPGEDLMGAMKGHAVQGKPEYHVSSGRWPANVVHDGSDEVVGMFPQSISAKSSQSDERNNRGHSMFLDGRRGPENSFDDSGSAARFFYTAKASSAERAGSTHPTTKPVSLMRWLVRLVCPPGATCLDPFAGSGTTGEAAYEESRQSVLIEREAEYYAMACTRLESATKQQNLFAGAGA